MFVKILNHYNFSKDKFSMSFLHEIVLFDTPENSISNSILLDLKQLAMNVLIHRPGLGTEREWDTMRW